MENRHLIKSAAPVDNRNLLLIFNNLCCIKTDTTRHRATKRRNRRKEYNPLAHLMQYNLKLILAPCYKVIRQTSMLFVGALLMVTEHLQDPAFTNATMAAFKDHALKLLSQ